MLKLSFTNRISTKLVPSSTMCLEITYNCTHSVYILWSQPIRSHQTSTANALINLTSSDLQYSSLLQAAECTTLAFLSSLFFLTLSCSWHRECMRDVLTKSKSISWKYQGLLESKPSSTHQKICWKKNTWV